MNNLNQLLRHQQDMVRSYTNIKNDPLDINKLMTHVGILSKVVDQLISDKIRDSNMVHESHMEVLAQHDVPNSKGVTRPMVGNITPWRAAGAIVVPGEGVNLSEVPHDKIMVWSDQHFFHNNIIQYAKRPFVDIEDMHARLIAAYNAVVGPTDIVLWVGDVSFAGVIPTNELLKQCNGYNILVAGNHDFDNRTGKLRLMDFDEIHTSILFDNIVVTHHPWKAALPKELWNVHGHLHNTPFSADRHINVSVEMINYQPQPLDVLLKDAGYYDEK